MRLLFGWKKKKTSDYLLPRAASAQERAATLILSFLSPRSVVILSSAMSGDLRGHADELNVDSIISRLLEGKFDSSYTLNTCTREPVQWRVLTLSGE